MHCHCSPSDQKAGQIFSDQIFIKAERESQVRSKSASSSSWLNARRRRNASEYREPAKNGYVSCMTFHCEKRKQLQLVQHMIVNSANSLRFDLHKSLEFTGLLSKLFLGIYYNLEENSKNHETWESKQSDLVIKNLKKPRLARIIRMEV